MDIHDESAPPAQRYHEDLRETQFELSLRSIGELRCASSRQELSSVSLISALDNDSRPSFVVDIHAPQDGPLDFVYSNVALTDSSTLLTALREGNVAQSMFADAVKPHVAFKQWLWSRTDTLDLAMRGDAYEYADYFWWATTVGHHRSVSGVPAAFLRRERSAHDTYHPNSHIELREHEKPKHSPQLNLGRLPMATLGVSPQQLASLGSPTGSSTGPFDYTRDPPCPNMSGHIEYFRSVDWENTPLGPMDSWSCQLRSMANMILKDHHHAVLFWGEEATMIYNDRYVELIGILHPCMGQSAKTAAKDLWPHLEPTFQRVKTTGRTFSTSHVPLFLERHGFIEEAYFSFQFIPILDGNGHVAGYYQPLVETTSNTLLERRISSLVEIGSKTAKARDLNAYWDLIISTISTNDRDTPFALLYAAEDLSTPGMSAHHSPRSSKVIDKFILKGSIGVEAGHVIAPKTIDLKIDSSVFHSHLVQATQSMMPAVVHFSDLQLQNNVLEEIDWKGFGDQCRCVVIYPIRPTTSEQVQGFLILGVNPRRPFDEDYKQYFDVMLRLLATSLASVVLFDEEMRQKENAIGQAALIQEELAAQLRLKERKFQRYADQSDVAIFVIDSIGTYTYRNQGWYDIFNKAVDAKDIMDALAQTVWPEDVPFCEKLFSTLVVEKVPICYELRTNMRWEPPTASEPDIETREYYKWVLCSAYPELDINNQVLEIVGNVTDISKQKWAEDVQKRRTDCALESKQHLEHFIDTTSHEMRNPLSAIMQCADSILTSYPESELDVQNPSPATYATLLDQTLDAAQTIAQCAQHMKRIVDDILTVSKLDSGLLIITPIDAQPETVTKHAVKMFESEAKTAGVELIHDVDESYRKLSVNWVSLDPTRLLQVLINLITNALKFTQLEPDPRRIVVRLSASEQEPTSNPSGVQFETKLMDNDPHLVEDWKKGSSVYLQFSVSDTGRGLSEDERSTLFARFSQASPRTHIHYGGSGLGLFISRRLTEMQGGAIGLMSEFKKGTTFSFYVKARRAGSTRMRRLSIPNIFPEDMRHRATTRREISELHNRPESPVSERSSPASRRFPSPRKDEGIPVLNQPKPPGVQRRQTALQSSMPNAALERPSKLESNVLRPRKTTEKLHVLVVEDNLVNQKVLAKQLRNLGCVVSVANHGGEALDFLKTTSSWRDENKKQDMKPQKEETQINGNGLPTELSLILMDWEMPVMNGLTAVTKIRGFEQAGKLTGYIPIIGVTANVRQQQVQMAMDVGMDDVVSKPFRVPELMSRMRDIVDDLEKRDTRRRGMSLDTLKEGEE